MQFSCHTSTSTVHFGTPAYKGTQFVFRKVTINFRLTCGTNVSTANTAAAWSIHTYAGTFGLPEWKEAYKSLVLVQTVQL